MFDCTEIETFFNSLPKIFTACLQCYINYSESVFTDRYVINTDGVFSQPQDDIRPLTSKPLHNPSTLHICSKIIRFGTKLRNVLYNM